ncbi:MAG: aldehyde dehydrogenase [Planctomycetota bacterium]|jgi:aminomuconate-semialdehyde/2-hydroxymuconate-6-semialdehyde dehydrogenase
MTPPTTLANYINGRLVAPMADRYLDNDDPSTGMPYSRVPDSDEQDVNAAVEAARNAFSGWSGTPAAARCRIMCDIADSIEANLDDLALAECVDNGKPLSLAKSLDIPRAATNFRFFATAILHLQSECHAMDNMALNYTLRKPRGVAGLISPWNLPLYLFTWKVAPALATGNTVVAKPSEVTPVTAHMLAEICIDCGLPPGVLNIVHGAGPRAGAPIVSHPDVPTISFTGGTVTGREIARTAAPLFKKYSLELGGKNPNVIFADADLEEAVSGSIKSSFANQGQICLAGSRILIESSAYETFTSRLVEEAGALRVGDPLLEGTQQGAVVSRPQYEKICRYLDLAREEGGTMLCGGGPVENLPERCKSGFFIQPTVIAGLDANCRTNQEEIFGPVVTVQPFDSEKEVIEMCNGTPYGLSATVWTQNLDRAHYLAEQIQSGTVWVNCWLLRDLRVPFGGMKQSGVGREGGNEAIRFFTEPKNICIKSGKRG